MIFYLQIFLTLLSSALSNERLPDIDYISHGYNLLKGNPLVSSLSSENGIDPGFSEKIFSLTYNLNRTTGNGQYQIPDQIDVLETVSCSYKSTTVKIFGQTSYSNELSKSISISGEYLTAKFAASYDYKQISKMVYSDAKIIINTGAICSSYIANTMKYLKASLSDNFIAGVLYISKQSDIAAYYEFINTFGTQYLIKVYMGASYTRSYVFTQQNYSTYSQTNSDISAAASASFELFTGGASDMTKQQIREAHTFNSMVTSVYESTIGSVPSTDGKWQTWAISAGKNPVPFKYALAPIYNLITSRNFPNMTDRTLDKTQTMLKQALDTYCSYLQKTMPHLSCTGPNPDINLDVHVIVSNSAKGSVNVYCPTNTQIISVGFAEIDGREPFPKYQINNKKSATCYDYYGVLCNAICTSKQNSIVTVTSRASNVVTATCGSGYQVANCAISVYNQPFNKVHKIQATLVNNACVCFQTTTGPFSGGYSDVMCQASCVKTEMPIKSVGTYGPGLIFAVCPPDLQVVGCGFQIDSSTEYWQVYPDINNNRCICYNINMIGCIAFCSDIYAW